MHNFDYHNSTRIFFGKNRVDEAGKMIQELGDSILLVTGSSSARKSGLLARVKTDIEATGTECTVLEGVKSNPLLSKVHEGIRLVTENNIKAVVALGGGSVMDTAKAVAAGSVSQSDVWDFFEGKKEIEQALPVVTIPTLAASGSEMNGFMVITNEESGYKLAAGSDHIYPQFSILDPQLTFSVPSDYTAYGAVDAVCHLLESYFNGSATFTPVTDRMSEGFILSIVDCAKTCLEQPENYNARASLMWASSLALCGLGKTGVGDHFFPVHLLEHAVSALFPVAHGAGLAALLPGWMSWKSEQEGGNEKICQFGTRVFNSDNETQAAILEFAKWIKSIGCPVNLAEIGIKDNDLGRLAENALYQAEIWGVSGSYSFDVMNAIYKRAVNYTI